MVDIRRASTPELRGASLRVEKHLPPSNASLLEDVLECDGELPTEEASLLLMAAQTCEAGSRSERVALEFVGHIRLSRPSRKKFESLLGPTVSSMAPAFGYSRRVAKHRGSPLAKASVQVRGLICEALRRLYIPYAPSVRGAGQPTVRPEGMSAALRMSRTSSRVAKDAARAESGLVRVFDSRYGYLMKYSLPASKVDVSGAPKGGQPATPTLGRPQDLAAASSTRSARGAQKLKQRGPARERTSVSECIPSRSL